MKNDTKILIGYICFIALLVAFTIVISIKSYQSGSKDSHYEEICIRGHIYLRSNFMAKMGLSIALDENGKPIPCVIKR